MKCKQCGANYKTKELKCPYCHTPNQTGKKWHRQRENAQKKYEKAKGDALARGIPYVISKILKYLAITFGILIVVDIIAVVLFFIMEYGEIEPNKSDAQKKMEEYYNEEKYLDLYYYMSDNNLLGEEYYRYSQAALLTKFYYKYQADKMMFLKKMEEGKFEDTYYVENVIKSSAEIYQVDVGMYSDEISENNGIYEKYRQEVKSFWIGMLNLTEEEMELLMDEDYYFSCDTEEMARKVIERGIN